jgi:predicted DNA-binding antitoxin AbrB/MazE fold protein
MSIQIEAVYEHGVLRPLQPLTLAEGEKVALNVIPAAKVQAKRLSKAERDAKDMEIINRNADRLNEEAMDVLKYQIEL